MPPRSGSVVAAMILVQVVPAALAQPPAFVAQDVVVPSHDGTQLFATLFLPAGAGPFPALLLPHGFGATRQQMAPYAERYARTGWACLTYDARGFGQSGGEVSLNGPKEVGDVSVLIDYLAARPEVLLDGPGDPRLGMRGGSYGGAIQLLAAAADPRIDVVVPMITWNDLEYSLAPNGVLKLGWTTLFYGVGKASGHGATTGNPNTGGFSSEIDRYFLEAVANGGPTPEIRDYLRQRSPAATLQNVRAPALLVQGWKDTLFTASEAAWTFRALTANGVPSKLLIYDGGHGYEEVLSAAEIDAREQRIDDWLAHWLEGRGRPEQVLAAPVEWWDDQAKAFVGDQAWPAVDRAGLTLYLDGDGSSQGRLQLHPPTSSSRSLMAAGGLTSYSEIPAAQAQLPTRSLDAPVTSLNYVSEPLPFDARLTGSPVLVLLAGATSPDVALFAKLYDVGPAGGVSLIHNQVTPLKVSASDLALNSPATVEVNLTDVSHLVAAGHRVRLVLASSDSGHIPNRVPAAAAVWHEPFVKSRLELSLYPIRRASDGRPPVLLDVDVQAGVDVTQVSAAFDDPSGTASAHLVARGPASNRTWSAVAAAPGRFLFHLPAVSNLTEFYLFASDPAGNQYRGEWTRLALSVPATHSESALPGPDAMLLAWAALAGVITLRRRRRSPGATTV